LRITHGWGKLSDEVYNFLHKTHQGNVDTLILYEECSHNPASGSHHCVFFSKHQHFLEDKFDELVDSTKRKMEQLANALAKKFEKQKRQDNLKI